jgi:hypothetical protein
LGSLGLLTISRLKTDKDNKEMRGLKIATATHIFLKVFGKTPGFCCSIKLALDSNPVIPSWQR